VIQFHHLHGFRAQVVEALQAELPHVWHDLLVAGAETITAPTGAPGPQLMGIRCRRLTFERVLRAAAQRQPGVRLRTGHVDQVCTDRGRASGVRIDGATLQAELVIVASGRAGRLGRELRAPARGGDWGIAYVSRQYRHARRRARPARPDRPLPRLPADRVPARQRDLLHPHRPIQR